MAVLQRQPASQWVILKSLIKLLSGLRRPSHENHSIGSQNMGYLLSKSPHSVYSFANCVLIASGLVPSGATNENFIS